MGSTGATNATADAKRAMRRLLDATDRAAFDRGVAFQRAGRASPEAEAACVPAWDALLRAADALIEALRDIEALPTHGRPRRYTEMARDALARVAAMDKADIT